MALTDTEIKKAKPSENDYQIGDSRGLSLVIRKKGTKTWRYEFRINGKKDKYHYGNYPEISLLDARKIHAIARQLVEFGRHPSTLLDNPGAKQLVIDGCGVKEIEAKAAAIKEAQAMRALMTFGDAAAIYKTEHVNKKWKDPNIT